MISQKVTNVCLLLLCRLYNDDYGLLMCLIAFVADIPTHAMRIENQSDFRKIMLSNSLLALPAYMI
jgi:hypothetical protein